MFESLRDELVKWIFAKTFNPAEKINAVRNIYSALDIRDKAEAEMEKYFQSALYDLQAINQPEERKSVLREFAEQLMLREV